MRTLTLKELRKLVSEFPFIPEVADFLQLDFKQRPRYYISIKVDVMDSQYLYSIPKYCLQPLWFVTRDNKLVGQYRSYGYAIDSQNKILRTKIWGPSNGDTFFKEVIGDGKDVSTVVLVEKYKWNHFAEDWFKKVEKTPFYDFSHYEDVVYIKKSPKQGFEALVRETDLSKNVRITNILDINSAKYDGNPEAIKAMNELEAIKLFFRNTLGREIWSEVAGYKGNAMSAKFGNTELLSFVTGGRIMVTLTCGQDTISFVGNESNYEETGLTSVGSTIDNVKKLLQDVIDNWKPNSLKPDIEVFPGSLK